MCAQASMLGGENLVPYTLSCMHQVPLITSFNSVTLNFVNSVFQALFIFSSYA